MGGELHRVVGEHGVGDVDLIDGRTQQQRGGDLEGSLFAGTQDEQVSGVLAGQQVHAQRAGGAGTHTGDVGGVHDADGNTGVGVVDHHNAVEGRQALFPVLRKVVQHLQAVELYALDIAGTDVHGGVLVHEFIVDQRPDHGLALGFQTIDLAHLLDDFLHGDDLLDLLAVQNQNAHIHPCPFVFSGGRRGAAPAVLRLSLMSL